MYRLNFNQETCNSSYFFDTLRTQCLCFMGIHELSSDPISVSSNNCAGWRSATINFYIFEHLIFEMFRATLTTEKATFCSTTLALLVSPCFFSSRYTTRPRSHLYEPCASCMCIACVSSYCNDFLSIFYLNDSKCTLYNFNLLNMSIFPMTNQLPLMLCWIDSLLQFFYLFFGIK